MVIGVILDAIREMIAANKDRSFDGIGISLPGRLDLGSAGSAAGKSRATKPIFAPNIRWPIAHNQVARGASYRAARLVADNVANACALSEVWFGDSDGLHDLVVVNVPQKDWEQVSLPMACILRGEGGSAGGSLAMCKWIPMGCHAVVAAGGVGRLLAANPAGLRY